MKNRLLIAPSDPWADVEGECPHRLSRQAHAGRLHLISGAGIACGAWRPLAHGERATDAWIAASCHRIRAELRREHVVLQGERHTITITGFPLEVPGAREAVYPEPTLMAFQLDLGRELDRQAEANAVALRAYYAARRAPQPAPRMRIPSFGRAA